MLTSLIAFVTVASSFAPVFVIESRRGPNPQSDVEGYSLATDERVWSVANASLGSYVSKWQAASAVCGENLCAIRADGSVTSICKLPSTMLSLVHDRHAWAVSGNGMFVAAIDKRYQVGVFDIARRLLRTMSVSRLLPNSVGRGYIAQADKLAISDDGSLVFFNAPSKRFLQSGTADGFPTCIKLTVNSEKLKEVGLGAPLAIQGNRVVLWRVKEPFDSLEEVTGGSRHVLRSTIYSANLGVGSVWFMARKGSQIEIGNMERRSFTKAKGWLYGGLLWTVIVRGAS